MNFSFFGIWSNSNTNAANGFVENMFIVFLKYATSCFTPTKVVKTRTQIIPFISKFLTASVHSTKHML